MASRKDVAKLAGVSPASVSYYVNKNGYVSKKTGDKIQKAIDELQYVPNQIARSLKIKNTKQLLFLCNDIRNPFYSQLVYRATKSAANLGYTILFSSVVDNEDYINKILSYQVSGVFASNNKMDVKQINKIAKAQVPVVLLRDLDWDDLDSSVSLIKVDFSSIMKEIVTHLTENGCDSIHYISSSSINNLDAKAISFINAMKGKSFSIIEKVSATKEAHDTIYNTYKEKEDFPSSFVCTNDAVALGCIRAVIDRGLRVPEDVKVVGFDNTNISQYSNPEISTVDIDSEAIGDFAVTMLLDKINGKKRDHKKIIPRLIVRKSSMK
ncbi:MAG: LacI family DNA-binding transcriptional regulator [Sphaerochaetaceae bacterium]|nr:LacI family DNA-binding transcriptional regulator [Sphaerochaetaceae bacterium]